MKKVLLGFIIAMFAQFITCYPADDPISSMLSGMAGLANKSESTMQSITTTKNTTQTFTSETSNLLLEAAKKLDITNFTSDEEFLSLLFESVFNIIKDTKSEETLLISDLSAIIPSLIEKFTKSLQTAFFNKFFGGLVPSSLTNFANLATTAVNASTSAADVGLKLATALETGKLNAASQGIETAEKVADTIVSSVPSNAATDEVKKIVTGSLDSAKGAVDAAKTLETEGSKALSGLLNSFKLVNASTSTADVGLKLATALETGKLNATSQGTETAEKVADTIASTVPSNGATDEVKKIAGKLNAASQGIKTAEKAADTIASSVPSNGATDEVKKIVTGFLDSAKGAVDEAKTLETEGSKALSGLLNSFKLGK